jgi:hypothetical protein
MSADPVKDPVDPKVDAAKPEDDGTNVDPWTVGENIDYNKLVSMIALSMYFALIYSFVSSYAVLLPFRSISSVPRLSPLS